MAPAFPAQNLPMAAVRDLVLRELGFSLE